MDVGSMVNQGLIGMQRSQAEMTSSAQQIAQASATPVTANPAGDVNAAVNVTNVSNVSTMNVVEPLIEMQAQQQVFDSSARVVQTADENLGRLIDTLA